MRITNQNNRSQGKNFGIKLASCEADERQDTTPLLTRNSSLVFDDVKSSDKNESPTPLLRAKPKLSALVNFANNTDIMDASDSESEHSLCDDVGDYDYFF
jgi:hypothetical protein